MVAETWDNNKIFSMNAAGTLGWSNYCGVQIMDHEVQTPFQSNDVPAQHAYVSESVKCARLQGLLGINTLCRNVITKLLEDEWIGSLPSTRLKLHM